LSAYGVSVRAWIGSNEGGGVVKTFSCGEIVPDCPVVFEGADYEDLLQQVADHAREVHGLVTLPSEVIAAVRASAARNDALA
jgi:predicted small metal-binding protein